MSIELPKAFVERIQGQYPEEYIEFLGAIKKTPVTSIRLNPKKKIDVEIDTDGVLWNPYGYYLSERPSFYLDPNFHNGRYYVQDSSSMFIHYIFQELNTKYPIKNILDLCAAPGGKSTILLDNLELDQTLVANELIPKRNLILRENLTKWGNPQFIVTQNTPKDYESSKFLFDLILVDAPCSGEGMFRKDPVAIQEWSEKNVAKCVKRQTEILENAWNTLQEGGVLIYSTCTFNPDENEHQVQTLLESHPDSACVDISCSQFPNIRTIHKNGVIGYSFLPHLMKGEGFFVSVIQKKGSKPLIINKKTESKSHINPKISPYLSDEYKEGYSTFKFHNNLFLATNHTLDLLPLLQPALYIKQVGIDVGIISPEDTIPSHGLSMLAFQSQKIPTINLSLNQALDYLAILPISYNLPDDRFYEVFYEKYPLGWVEKKKGRELNHYPSNLRLKKRH